MPITPPWKKAQYNRRYYLKHKGRTHVPDTKGERTKPLRVQLPESLIGRLNRLVIEGVAVGKWPWRTMSQCVKMLVIDGLSLHKGDDTVDEMLPHLEYMSQIDRIHQLRREAQAGLNKAREEINELLGIGAYDGAVRYYHMTIEAAERMPPTEWRNWMIKELRKAFPNLDAEAITPMELGAETKSKPALKKR